MKKTILHCDLNCFFASVEMLYHPEYRNVPMAVAGDPEKRHGIILAKNVPAKKKGIRTAETINEALQKCPELIILKPDYHSYEYFSERVRDLYYEYTDRIEPFGVDECWLDISGSLSYFGGAEAIVSSLLNRIREEIGLTLSIGVSFNKVYAKLGSDMAKEDDFCRIDSLDDIRHLSASKLLFIGSHTCEILKSHGIYTIGDLADHPMGYLENILGKAGKTLYCYANGIGSDEITRYDHEAEMPKSISCCHTAERDLCSLDDFKIVLTMLCDEVATRLRKQGLYYRKVHLLLRTKQLKVRTMQMSLKENSDLAKDIYDNALALFERNADFSIPYRSIGVSVSDLSYQKQYRQTSLFEESTYSIRQKKQELAIQQIRDRFGKDAIVSLRVMEDQTLSRIGLKNNEPFEEVIHQ